jgi:hypothetical protein
MGLCCTLRQKTLKKPGFFRDFIFTSTGPSRMIEIDCGAVFRERAGNLPCSGGDVEGPACD